MKKAVMSIMTAMLFLTTAGLVGCERDVGDEGFGEDVGTFETWDTDRDGYLDENEFRTGYGGWDTDRDGLISEREFGG